ncbi:MAG TPA: 2-C-methyl-D-erythritol 4-phosphate cytidylyltransferase [Solirubrobacteraceae bacterium]|nr:2-C-methyl-D-erythritol 4-phosphate cytidylyltransferase [Solirubrobacteraceae bacterium]
MAVALLVAAGSGERLGAGRPKAFVELAGRPMLAWSLDAVRAAGITAVIVAAPPEIARPGETLRELAGGEDAGGEIVAVAGGVTRSESVRAALAAAPPGDVVVHDAARPLVTPDVFTATLAALAGADCAIAAAPVPDTIKEAGADRLVTATLDRSRLWAIQTPQAFRRDALERALDVPDDVLAAATDDAWLVERTGGTVRVVESTAANFKVTTPHDLRIAELLLADRLPPAPAP